MESTEEDFSSFTSKGRRTKRQRSIHHHPHHQHDGCSDDSHGSSSSTFPSDDHDATSVVTTEEDDMAASCLILLAQGKSKTIITAASINNHNNNNNNNNTNIIITTTTSNNNNNNYSCVYECKTCSKTFTSFQALGGHRTSHTKAKPPSTAVRSPDHHDDDHDDDIDHHETKLMLISSTWGVDDKEEENDNKLKERARVHECSICGSKFPSGQALGGHMRRHRVPSAAPAPDGRSIISATTLSAVDSRGPGPHVLSLDLNLPAPDDHDDQLETMETKFRVLHAPAPLVDCHY